MFLTFVGTNQDPTEPFGMEELLHATQEVENTVNEEGNASESLALKEQEKTFRAYDSTVQEIINEQDKVIGLQEEIVTTSKLLGGLLTVSERNSIKEEVNKAKEVFNLHIRDEKSLCDIHDIFNPHLFKYLVDGVRTACPTITNILEQLVLSSNTSRNTIKTESLKMKAAVHLLASLLDVRDQHSRNDIPLLFGLLCICYGAGPAMIRILQRIGLSESFPTL